MEKLINALKSRQKSPHQLTRESELFTTIIEAIQDKKGENIASLDLTGIEEAVADFFVLCEADSELQIKAIADEVERAVKEQCRESAYHTEKGEGWTLIDYVNIVVHVFKPEERRFYDLEGLWMDSERMQHPAGGG